MLAAKVLFSSIMSKIGKLYEKGRENVITERYIGVCKSQVYVR